MPDPALHHVVITRFNIASPGREAAIRNRPGWLERRFDLFEAYCLPGMAAQTVHDFEWLVYFDEATPDAFRSRIAAAQESVPFSAKFTGPLEMANTLRDIIVPAIADRLVTTRLDNDDAVAVDLIERIQTAARHCAPGTVLNFPNGLALRDRRLFAASDPSNPFTSLVEDAHAPLSGIWSVRHDALAERFQVRQVDAPPVWLQVVHGDNVSNRIKGARVPAQAVAGRFVLKSEMLAEGGAAALAVDRVLAAPLRTARERAILLLKRARALLRR
ncbi:MAG: glycosyltransferase [Alteraurantiacibacter sp.]